MFNHSTTDMIPIVNFFVCFNFESRDGAAIFFSMHIWNLIHDAPFHCHRNVTALSPENTGCHLTTKCHSGTLTQARKEKSELKQLILMTTKCFSSIKMKMIYTSCRFLLLLWISILKRKINFLYVKNLRQCDTFKNSPFKESFCCKLACHSTFFEHLIKNSTLLLSCTVDINHHKMIHFSFACFFGGI